MQLEQSFTLPAAPAEAWPAFKNIALLIPCLPGAALTGPEVEGELPLRFDVKLGPIAAGFAGTGRVSYDDVTHSGCFEGQAADRRTNSRVKGAANFRLEAEGNGSRVTVQVDYSLTGTLAQFNRGGIVREMAAALTAQFAANLSQRMQAPPSNTAPSTGTPPPMDATAPLNASALMAQVLKSRWQRLLNWLRRRPA